MDQNIKSRLSEALENIPEIDFAFLFGSAVTGELCRSSDIDIAVYLNQDLTLDLISKIVSEVEKISGHTCDLSILNQSTEIFSFEVLKGELLFVRESKIELYAGFYSITCREYEDKMVWMKKQLAYRGYLK